MRLTNQEEKHRAAANPSWSHMQGLRSVRHTKLSTCSIKAAGHHCLPMQHTKEVLISTDYNCEKALISTNQCLARLIVTFLVVQSYINRQVNTFLYMLAYITFKFRKNRCMYFVNLLNVKHSLVYQKPCCIK